MASRTDKDGQGAARSVSAVIAAARPNFHGDADKIAFAAHAYLLGAGYRLIATGDNAQTAFDAVDTEAEEVAYEGDWNLAQNGHVFSFCYIPDGHDEVRVIVRMIQVGQNICITALSKKKSEGHAHSDSPVTADFKLDKYVQGGSGRLSARDAFKDFKGLCSALGNFESQVSAQFLPSSSLGRSVEVIDGDVTRGGSRSPRWNPPGMTPPFPLVEPSPLLHGDGSLVGADDLVPPGIRPPGSIHPGLGPFGGRGGGLRGSHVGPDDPIFSGMGGRRDGRRPPGPGLPPGARWDPINPQGIPGFHPDDFIPDGRPVRDRDVHPDIGPPPGGGGGMDHMFG